MKSNARKDILFLLFTLYLLLALNTTSLALYEITDLGTMNYAFERTFAYAINDHGDIAGDGDWYPSESGNIIFFWSRTTGMQEIIGFGGKWHQVWGINNSRQVVGYSDDAEGNRHAFVWQNGIMLDLGPGYARGINNNGQVIGVQWIGGNSSSPIAFIWDSTNGMQFPFGSGDIRPQAITDIGQVVGAARNGPSFQAFIWDSVNGIRFLDKPSGYFSSSTAVDINNFGQIVGDASNPNHFAFIWYSINEMEGLGILSGGYSRASAINSSGIAVGYANVTGSYYEHGFIWDNNNGIQDLGTLIILLEGFEFIQSTNDINEAGQIAATASIGGVFRAVLLTPVPQTITVEIDIHPGGLNNSINPKSKGKIPVAILSTQEFYAPEMVNKETLTFGPIGHEDSLAFCNPKGEDVNGDGVKDLVCHFYTQDAGFQCGDTEGFIMGETVDGTSIEGKDSVRIVPCT